MSVWTVVVSLIRRCLGTTQTRNSGRAEQCWVWLGATEGGLVAVS